MAAMESPNLNLDRVCKSILHFGLILLRNAALDGDFARCRAESEHLHNLPSLIGDPNLNRHLYYFQHERPSYLQWVHSTGRADLKSDVDTFYEPLWKEMAMVLFEGSPS